MGGKAVAIFCFVRFFFLVACFRRGHLFSWDGSGCRRMVRHAGRSVSPGSGVCVYVRAPSGRLVTHTDTSASADTSYKYPLLDLENRHASCHPSTGSNTSTPPGYSAKSATTNLYDQNERPRRFNPAEGCEGGFAREHHHQRIPRKRREDSDSCKGAKSRKRVERETLA